jgi:hypothetical protein
VYGSGFRVCGLRFWVWGLGFRVQGLRFRAKGLGLGIGAPSLGFGISGIECRVQRFRISSCRFLHALLLYQH